MWELLISTFEELAVPVAEARAALGLPGTTPKVAKTVHDRMLMRQALAAAGLPVVRDVVVENVDAAVGSGAHGKTKPHPAIFLSALGELGVRAEEAAMVGDSPEDDIAGARALGMRAFLVDREGRFPEAVGMLPDLFALPAALGLAADSLADGE